MIGIEDESILVQTAEIRLVVTRSETNVLFAQCPPDLQTKKRFDEDEGEREVYSFQQVDTLLRCDMMNGTSSSSENKKTSSFRDMSVDVLHGIDDKIDVHRVLSIVILDQIEEDLIAKGRLTTR